MIEEYYSTIISIILGFLIIEILFYLIILFVNKKFQWLIMAKDKLPSLPKNELKKFIDHGYDKELGWIRKPNTSHIENGKEGQTKWSINSNGSRLNPGYDHLNSKISCYGDSFTFCRQVNDKETWEHNLSILRETNVSNFGVGNYGLDQVFLRLRREYDNNPTKTVLIGVVPDTISRILSVWKHYYEYGNTFGFKPRYKIHKGKLKLVKNFIDNVKKFENFQEFLNDIKKYDFFYKEKFEKEIIHFPYCITVFRNCKRNFSIIFWILKIQFSNTNKKILWEPMKIIMNINLKWRIKLFQNTKTTLLFKKILEQFVIYSKEKKFKLIFFFLPQKDDLLFIKQNFHFYEEFIKEIIKLDGIQFIDITNELLGEENLDELYSNENDYGGHFSKKGNEKIAMLINQKLK